MARADDVAKARGSGQKTTISVVASLHLITGCGSWREGGAIEEEQLEVGLEGSDCEEPAVAGHAVPDPVPLDGFVDAGDLACHDACQWSGRGSVG